MHYSKDWKPHSSHKMTKWKETIVTLIATPRFGRVRYCAYCGAGQAETVAGRDANQELALECLYAPK